MDGKEYEVLEHTADIGIRVKADGLQGLFRSAARAMFDISAEPKSAAIKAFEKVKIKQGAENLEELFINWLNELLSVSATKELIFSDFKIDTLKNNHLEAVAFGSPTENFKVNAEIKAATYHALKLEKTGSGWLAEVIFDV
jgi:SHS2 domain-containing protein